MFLYIFFSLPEDPNFTALNFGILTLCPKPVKKVTLLSYNKRKLLKKYGTLLLNYYRFSVQE